MSRGLGRVQNWVLLRLYHDRNSGEWCKIWQYQRHDRVPGTDATARNRAHRASVRRSVRRLADLGLAECEVRSGLVRQIDIHGEEHPGGMRDHLVAKITPAGIDYVRARGLDPVHADLQRLRRIVGSYGRGGPGPPHDVWERLRVGSPFHPRQRLFNPEHLERELIRRGADRSRVRETADDWLSTLRDVTVPDDRAYELLLTYDEVEMICLLALGGGARPRE
ncbi:hypothetical protein [Nocardia grenadensis]